mgnify:FL=1
MKTHRLGITLLVFCVLLMFGNISLTAQDRTDWSSWTSVVVNHKFNNSLRLMSKVQVRTRDNFSAFERFFVNAGLGYKVLPKWELKAVFAYHCRSSASKGKYNAYRYHIGSEATWKKGDFRIRWRERFQQTFAFGDVENIIRSRLMFDYNIPSTILAPYFSIETFNDLENDDSFKAERIRYMPGLKINLSEMYSLSVFYCRQDDVSRKTNIAGVEFIINL